MSIAANIAEGFTRESDSEKVRFYNLSQGSIEACRYCLILARDLGYLEPGGARAEFEEASRVLTGCVAGVRQRQSHEA